MIDLSRPSTRNAGVVDGCLYQHNSFALQSSDIELRGLCNPADMHGS